MKKNYSFLSVLIFSLGLNSFAQDCSVNQAPQVSFISAVGLTCGDQLYKKAGEIEVITVAVVDPEGDNVTLDISGLPASAIPSMTLPASGPSPLTLVIQWTPVENEVGIPHPVVFAGSDACNPFGIPCVLTFNVTCSNPTITCPSDTTVQANFLGCRATVLFDDAIVTGLPAPTVIYSPPSGSMFSEGTTTVNVTAFNSCSTVTCSFTVTVANADPPTIVCPANITADATSCTGGLVEYHPSASSHAGILSLLTFPVSCCSATFPIGNTTITAVATDDCLTTSTCEFTVTVESPDPPAITCPQSITVEANSNECKSVQSITVSASSAVGLSTIAFVDPPFTINAFGQPTHTTTIGGVVFPLGTSIFTVIVTDICGAQSTCSFSVTVIPGPPPQITTSPSITVTANQQGCMATTTYTMTATSLGGLTSASMLPGLSNNQLSNQSVTFTATQSFALGTNTVIATATDACGSTSTSSFDITVTSDLTVDAGPDVSSVFGDPFTQTVNRTATTSGGSGPISYSWTLSRPLKCNQLNTAGDELFSGGTCANYICPISTSPLVAPSCSLSSSISATLLAGADVCVTATDALGCTATDCFHIDAIDGRCFSTGNTNKKKVKVCHQTGSATNPWVQICLDKSVLSNFLSHHPNDFVGVCPIVKRLSNEESEIAGGLMFAPNPFSSVGTFRFTTSEDNRIELEIFSYTGAKVATLFSGDALAYEETEVQFDGSSLSNGIYLCKLTSGDQIYYTRIMLSK